MLRVATLASISIFLPLLSSAQSWEQGLPQQTREWLIKGDLTSELDLVVESVSQRYLTNTPYAGKLQINLPPKPQTLTFLMVKRDALGRFNNNLKCTCSVAPTQEAIICDAEFFNDFLNVVNTQDNQINISDRTLIPALLELDRYYRTFLGNWLIGHEIAHLLFRHHTTSTSTTSSSADEIQLQNSNLYQQWGREEELEADTYVLSRISRSEVQFSAFMTLSQMATSLYARLVELQKPEELRAAIEAGNSPFFATMFDVDVRFSRSGHPPWFIRVLEMADVLFKHYPNMVDTSGYWERLRARINPVPVAVGQPRDWACAEQLTGNPAKPLVGNSIIGDAELIDNLLDINEKGIITKRLLYLRDNLTSAGWDASWANTYSLLIEADLAARNGDHISASASLTSAESYFDTRDADDLGLLVLYARTLARAGTENADKIEDLLPRIEAAALAMEDHFHSYPRQLQIYYLDMWEVLKTIRPLEDPIGIDVQNALVASLVDNPHSIVTRALMTRWKRSIKLLENEAGETENLVNELLSYTSSAIALGMSVDAVLANKQALKILDEEAPEQIFVRAYWYDMLNRILIRIDPKTCAFAASSALALREEILELVKLEAPEQIDSAVTQVAIAGNQLGFCHISNLQWQDAIEPLELSHQLLMSLAQPNPVEVATVWHNLASAYVALGDRRALEIANKAFKERERLELDPLLVENSRSVYASALYLDGRIEESISVFKTWQERMTEIDDFRSPTDNMMISIDGQMVGLGEILGEDNIVSKRTTLSGISRFDYSTALLQSW